MGRPGRRLRQQRGGSVAAAAGHRHPGPAGPRRAAAQLPRRRQPAACCGRPGGRDAAAAAGAAGPDHVLARPDRAARRARPAGPPRPGHRRPGPPPRRPRRRRRHRPGHRHHPRRPPGPARPARQRGRDRDPGGRPARRPPRRHPSRAGRRRGRGGGRLRAHHRHPRLPARHPDPRARRGPRPDLPPALLPPARLAHRPRPHHPLAQRRTHLPLQHRRCQVVIITHMVDYHVPCITCLIYTRMSKDKLGDAHGVANQLADLEKRAEARGWTVTHRLSDNDIGVTRKDPTAAGKYRPGYEEALRLVDAHAVDVVFCWKWDRFIRESLDLEYLIPRFDKAGVRFAEADGIIDLGTDSGRLAARILVAVAKAEQERKSERQKLANEAAAVQGKRRLGTPRPFGYCDDHVTPHPEEGPAVDDACKALLGGGTLSSVMREWADAGLRPAQSKTGKWSRQSIRTILLNPRIAGLSAYRGEIVGTGEWEPLVAEETWRAVRGILEDPARKPPRGVRTLLGGLALCSCGNVATGMPSHTGHHIYRCTPATRNRAYMGTHVARQAVPVEEFIEKVVVGRLSRADAADLVAVEETGVDGGALREEAAAIRRN